MTSNAKKSAETAITAPDLFTGGLNPAEIAVGALSRRIPVFVIVDTQEDDREQIAGQLDGVIEWLYNFSPVSSYRNIRPGRISLSIFTASGTCLVPPRLLHQPRPEECGRIYFRNCTWIEKNALKAMLCQLPAEDGIKVDGLKDALGSLLLPQRNAPLNYMSAYAVNDGDAKFITLLLTRRNSEELLKIFTPFEKLCKSVCVWNTVSPVSSEQEHVWAFAGNSVEEGLSDWLGQQLTELSNDICEAFADPRLHLHNANLFPDAYLPTLRGKLPTVTFEGNGRTARCFASLVKNGKVLSGAISIRLPESRQLTENDLQLRFEYPAECFAGVTFSLVKNADHHILKFECSAVQWSNVFTGLLFRARIIFLESFVAEVSGSVWIPPQVPGKNNRKKAVPEAKSGGSKLPWVLCAVCLLCAISAFIFPAVGSRRSAKKNDAKVDVTEQSQADALQQKIAAQQKEIASLQSRLAQAEKGSGEKSTEADRNSGNNSGNEAAELRELTGRIEAQDREISGLRQKLTEAENSKQNNSRNASAHSKKLEEELAAAKKKIDELNQKLTTLKKESGKLQDKLSQSAENEKAGRQNAEKLKEQENTIKSLQGKLKQLEKQQNDDQQKQQAEAQNYQQEINKLKKQLNTQQGQKAEAQNYQQEINKLKKQLNSQQDKLKSRFSRETSKKLISEINEYLSGTESTPRELSEKYIDLTQKNPDDIVYINDTFMKYAAYRGRDYLDQFIKNRDRAVQRSNR